MPPLSLITGLPGLVGCGGGGEETGGLPVLPPPPQADEKIAAVIANTRNRRAEFVRLMKVEIGDIKNDMQDMDLSALVCLPDCGAHASVKIVSAYIFFTSDACAIFTVGEHEQVNCIESPATGTGDLVDPRINATDSSTRAGREGLAGGHW